LLAPVLALVPVLAAARGWRLRDERPRFEMRRLNLIGGEHRWQLARRTRTARVQAVPDPAGGRRLVTGQGRRDRILGLLAAARPEADLAGRLVAAVRPRAAARPEADRRDEHRPRGVTVRPVATGPEKTGRKTRILGVTARTGGLPTAVANPGVTRARTVTVRVSAAPLRNAGPVRAVIGGAWRHALATVAPAPVALTASALAAAVLAAAALAVRAEAELALRALPGARRATAARETQPRETAGLLGPESDVLASEASTAGVLTAPGRTTDALTGHVMTARDRIGRGLTARALTDHVMTARGPTARAQTGHGQTAPDPMAHDPIPRAPMPRAQATPAQRPVGRATAHRATAPRAGGPRAIVPRAAVPRAIVPRATAMIAEIRRAPGTAMMADPTGTDTGTDRAAA
jgi:hypothetical protein